MHFILLPHGTAGDIYPFLGIGLGLRRRGHAVTVVTHSIFRRAVEHVGLDYVDLDDAAEYREAIAHPDRWDPLIGPRKDWLFNIHHLMRRQYAEVANRYVPGETVMVSSASGLGPRIAHDSLGCPLVTAVTTPWFIRSAARPHTEPVANWLLRLLPTRGCRELAYWVGDRFAVDGVFGRFVNEFRAELKLPPVRRLIHRWHHSPQLILGLFPRWLVEPVPEDWPPVEFAGFPFFDPDEAELPPGAEEFLSGGEPPVVFTPGSGVAHATEFFAAAVDACRRLNCRGLLLTREPKQVPADLPPAVRHFPYLPLSRVFPRAAAFVSHGGLGGVASAMRAGLPQVIMPVVYDQPDVARRARRLGVAEVIPRRRFTGPRLADRLSAILTDSAVRRRCREVAALFPEGEATGPACDALETFAATANRRSPEARPVVS